MPEVYRFLFEVLGMDMDAPTAQPRERDVLPDIDHLSSDLETMKTWQDIASYKVPDLCLSKLFCCNSCENSILLDISPRD